MNAAVPPILITPGEPAGIGPDCVVLAFQSDPEAFTGTCVCAPATWLKDRAGMLGIQVAIHEVHAPETSSHGLVCWNPGVDTCMNKFPVVTPGTPRKETASAVITCIKAAAMACMEKKARAMVTGPIEKSVLRDAGFDFPGHTEFLAHLANVPKVVMMLAGRELRVALLTTHMALADVPAVLNVEDTLETLRITHLNLLRFFGIAHPKLALCGLNPHAGESGHFGREEIDILQPAAEQARRTGLDVIGPLPADTLFTAANRKMLDAIVCCYHDQGLIPLKTLSFGDAVNVTLGLPFIRTSVDHGTALDRAGSGKVSYSSLMAALHLARDMVHASVQG
ncbi:MAG: 4-hydroxythreonine-4-phosphate dehydrogenase PdxA [Mariprofundaceae bacterium]|nr:4-hydroxythreonine-4-phosphate dehydrogenase PdxA [Mariprofundaceae bacterium]